MIGVLVSGGGTNLQALLDRVHGREGVEIAAVASDKPAAPALERARLAEIPRASFSLADYRGRVERDRAMADWLAARNVELVVLAGYMQLLSDDFLARFPDRVINVHPALLPAFPGLDAQKQALDYGAKISGCTVHFVDEHLDHGPIVIQKSVPVLDSDDEHSLSCRILEQEHIAYTEAINLVLSGKFEMAGRRVRAQLQPRIAAEQHE